MANNNETTTKKTLKSLSIQTVVTVTTGIVEILVFSVMSRLLTAEDFGYYAAISAITLIFSSFSETGIGAALIQKKNIEKNFIDNAFTISLVFGTALTIVMIAMSGLLADTVVDKSITIPLMFMSLTLFLNCLTSVNISILYRRLEFKNAGKINLSSLIISSSLAILFAAYGFGYFAIMTRVILTSLLSCILSFLYTNIKYSLKFDFKTFKSIFSYSGWLMASVVFRNVSQQIDRLLMPNLLNVSLLGAYNRPKDFTINISNKLNGIFDTTLFPVLSGIQDNKNSLKNAFYKAFYLINLFSTLLGITFVLNSELIIRIFFGDNWLYLKPIFCVFSLVMIFNADGRLADCYLRSLGMTKEQFYFRVFETIVKFGCVILGTKGGIFGIAVLVVVADVFIKLLKILYVSSKIDVKFSNVLIHLLKSWFCCCFIIPVSIIIQLFLPNTLIGNLLFLFLFSIIIFIIFVLTPRLVGKDYYEMVYLKLISKFSHR